jgi:hypothetical protein
MASESSDLDGLHSAPWQVRTAIRLGLPTALAIVLLYFILHSVGDALTTLSANDKAIVANQAAIIEVLHEHQAATLTFDRSMVCLVTAKTDDQRLSCMTATTR